jgi:uncharacterized membrane protein YkvA (DUF1232 family)
MMESRDINKTGQEEQQTPLKEYALIAPRLLKLLGRLMRDPRVPARSKAILLCTVGYVLSPIDVIPDAMPRFGRIDDIVLTAFALDHILKRVPDHVLHEHWDGDGDVLEVIRNIIEIGAGLVPRWIRKLIPD